MHTTTVGVDLAKEVIQVCVVKRNKVLSNVEMTHLEFADWLRESQPVRIVFEACSTSNYWHQTAHQFGHEAYLVSAKLVSKIRQNQKTDKNDALAVVQASQLVDVQFIRGKTFSQQELQSILRMRELAVKQKVALRNQIQSLLAEFNIRVAPRNGGLSGTVQHVLEDAENGFNMFFREALYATWKAFESAVERIDEFDRLLVQAIKEHPDCEKLLALEGVSTINAVNLYIALSCDESRSFKTGRNAAACIGLTPTQHSSGGKTKLGSIGKYVKNGMMRSYLISGAMAVVNHVSKREPKTTKEQWLKQLIERRGKRCAAVALANKTVRTAFAMLSKGTEYQAQAITA